MKAVAGLAACLTGAAGAQADELMMNTGTYPVSGLRDGYAGNTFDGTLGNSFSTGSQAITVTALGYYDGPNSSSANTSGYTPDGLQDSHQVGIWNSSGTLLTSVTVPTSGTFAVNDFQYVSLSTPLTLSANSTYMIGGTVPANDETSGGDVFYTAGANAPYGPGISVTGLPGAYTTSTPGNLVRPTTPYTSGYLGPNMIYSVPFGLANGNFSSPAIGSYTQASATTAQAWNSAVPNWGDTVTNTASSGGAGVIKYTSPGGSQSGYINSSGNDIYQDMGAASPDTQYVISVDIALRLNGGSGAAGAIALLSGYNDTGSVLASTNYSFSSSAGTGAFTEYSFTYTTGATVNGDLTLEFSDTTGAGAQSVMFSEANVTTSIVPEPATIGSLSLLSFGLLRRKRRRTTPSPA